MIKVVVSGGFDPLHIGHLRHMQLASELGDKLVVILNNDDFLMRKKGYVFMPIGERKAILENIKCVDEVVVSSDSDQTVCKTLREIKPDIFAKGGDRTFDNIPEMEKRTCEEIGCKIVCGVSDQLSSSSKMVEESRANLSASEERLIYFEPAGQILHSHRYMFENPPNGYKFIVNENSVGAKMHGALNTNLYRFGLGSLPWHIIKPRIEKYTIKPFEGAYLTFAWNHVVFRNEPWIVHVEWAEMLTGFSLMWHHLLKHTVEKQLSSPNCKKIITWSEIARKSFVNYNCEGFEDKIEVVPLAVPAKNFERNYERDKVIFLSVCSATRGREDYNFHMKGGKEVFEAFRIISREYDNIELVIISDIPVEYMRKFGHDSRVKLITKRLSSQEVVPYYIDADVFLFPGHDTPFGVILEAMSYGLPVIATDVYGNKELVENGVTGFIIPASKHVKYFDGTIATRPMTGPKRVPSSIMKIDVDVVTNLVDKMRILIEDKQLRRKMSLACFDEISNGVHSIGYRNTKLKKIFDEVVK